MEISSLVWGRVHAQTRLRLLREARNQVAYQVWEQVPGILKEEAHVQVLNQIRNQVWQDLAYDD